MRGCLALIRRYDDLPPDFDDAPPVVLAAELGTDPMFLDTDFCSNHRMSTPRFHDVAAQCWACASPCQRFTCRLTTTGA